MYLLLLHELQNQTMIRKIVRQIQNAAFFLRFYTPKKLFLVTSVFGVWPGDFSDYYIHNLMCLVTSKLLRYESYRNEPSLKNMSHGCLISFATRF